MTLFSKSAPILCLFALTAFLSGCSSDRGTISHTEFCRNKLTAAEELFNKQKYGRAQDKLEEIISLCSGTGVMEKSSFLLAQSYFNLEEWIEALEQIIELNNENRIENDNNNNIKNEK